MAGGGFGLAITSELLVSVTSMCSARAKGDPPQPHQAPRRARRSPFCARVEAKVSCGPAGWGGWRYQKDGWMHNWEGIRKCQWSGVGPGLRWQDFLEGFQRPGRGGWCSGGAPKMVACSVDIVCNAAASPDKSALPGTSSNVHRGNRLVDVDVARPITPECRERGSSAAAPADPRQRRRISRFLRC